MSDDRHVIEARAWLDAEIERQRASWLLDQWRAHLGRKVHRHDRLCQARRARYNRAYAAIVSEGGNPTDQAVGEWLSRRGAPGSPDAGTGDLARSIRLWRQWRDID